MILPFLFFLKDGPKAPATDADILKEANDKIVNIVKTESDKALGQILNNASEHMKIRYHRGDN